ncbi:MAG: 3-phosphoshikimate 1-carboxyvinyltransferase [Thermodesulfobacteriota bacterium]
MGNNTTAAEYSVIVPPANGILDEVVVPGDKSISHRAVILGSIAEGTTNVFNFLEGEDNLSTIGAFRSMGVEIEVEGHDQRSISKPGRVTIKGVGLHGLKEPGSVIDAGNSGTTARLLLGLLSAQNFSSVITGDDSLRKRPMKRVVEPLKIMGASITGGGGGEYLPLDITGSPLKGISYASPVASAQVKSALLLAGLYGEGETVVEEPGKSRDHTERMLKLFGADVRTEGTRTGISKATSLKGCNISVPGDISSAAFLMAGALVTQGSEIIIKRVGVNPTRTGIIEVLRKMGATVELLHPDEISGEPVANILVRSSPLTGVEVSGEELLRAIDEFPVICALAAFAEGTTTITGAAELRVKESDRISAMAGALSAVGVKVEELPDGIKIKGMGGKVLGGTVESRGDHRVAMAMSVVGLGSIEGVTIAGAGCVDVSFPGFFDLLGEVARR